MPSLQLLTHLSDDFCQILEQMEEYNTMIFVGQESDIRVFHAHSIVLKARSEYFRAAFAKDWAKKDGRFYCFRKPNISPAAFEMILKYLYTAKIEVEDKDVTYLLDVLVAADELLLTEMTDCIESYLLQNKAEWLRQNYFALWSKTKQAEFCGKLQECCKKTVCHDPRYLFESDDFLSLDEELLISFLQMDEMQIDEIDVWKYVLKWGCRRIEKESENVHEWTAEDFAALADKLQPFFNHIRWHYMLSSDFYDKVWPFRQILPEPLLNDILQSHFDPEAAFSSAVSLPRRIPFESEVITSEQVSHIAAWIDRTDESYREYECPYTLHLLLRGSRDGFDAETFHDLCDEKGPTIVAVKVRNSGQIIGGYNPIQWVVGSGHIATSDSFIFSFPSFGVVTGARMSRPHRSNYAIRLNERTHGACFGDKDLWMSNAFNEDESCSCQQDDYSEAITSMTKFSAEEYE
ncbi:6642_t:CDS:2, partial [Paraglomus occultum]